MKSAKSDGKSTTSVAASITLAITLLLGGNAIVVSAASTSAADQSSSWIPPNLVQYLSTLSYNGHNLCLSGTVTPFTVKSHPCPEMPSLDIQSSYSLDCSSFNPGCQAGQLYTPINNFIYFNGYATLPSSVPSTNYCASQCSTIATSSYWIGLQNCVSGCGSTYLLQVGVLYGANYSYTSSSPVLFEEFAESSGSCHTTFCGYTSATLGFGDSLYFSVTYNSGSSPYWALFSEDSTLNIYQTYVVYEGTGSSQIPYTSLAYSLTVSEGSQTTSSSYFPPTFYFTSEVGEDTTTNYALGSHTDWHTTSATSPTATISSTTYSCGFGTCADNSIGWN